MLVIIMPDQGPVGGAEKWQDKVNKELALAHSDANSGLAAEIRTLIFQSRLFCFACSVMVSIFVVLRSVRFFFPFRIRI